MRAFLTRLHIEDERVDDVILAAGEAAGNAIEHAYGDAPGTIHVLAFVDEAHVVIEVRDTGRWRVGGDPERGRGLGIMRALVDRVSIESSRNGTKVRLELALRREARTP